MRLWADPRYGQAGFLAFGWWGILKAPWCRRLFSERFGYEKFHRLGFGWRWQVRRVRQPTLQNKEPIP